MKVYQVYLIPNLGGDHPSATRTTCVWNVPIHVHCIFDTVQTLFRAAVVGLTENEFIFLGVVKYLIEPHDIGVVQLLQDGYLSSDIIKRTFLFNLLHRSTTCWGGGVGEWVSLFSLSLSHTNTLSLPLFKVSFTTIADQIFVLSDPLSRYNMHKIRKWKQLSHKHMGHGA